MTVSFKLMRTRFPPSPLVTGRTFLVSMMDYRQVIQWLLWQLRRFKMTTNYYRQKSLFFQLLTLTSQHCVRLKMERKQPAKCIILWRELCGNKRRQTSGDFSFFYLITFLYMSNKKLDFTTFWKTFFPGKS